ncbi:Hcp family type VI secretion system effector [Pectobacterium versatile]|uniref:Hcp family type VI secretion system effector n=1 Tax=Pectobacterium versatile TaxID=2488639 RepID=UPI001B3A0DD4|nr:Hcp family type VI secretion system effector [Pectobacterium versatile]MBQ4772913.1 type VI secretion system tube protein Hcp [Pectobacterium versatile]MCO4313150.1 Hcp family type VI secretion system effector [Pectobacterium versatile]
MANSIYVTIEGQEQGTISSGCSTFPSIGNKYQIGHEDQIMVYSFEHVLTREQNINHGPISFIKPIDKSSPLLGVAISNNECLNLKFVFYRTSSSGAAELFYSIKLKDAYLIRVNVIYPHAIDHASNQPEEMITLKYQSITWEHHTAGTSGYSLWGENIY